MQSVSSLSRAKYTSWLPLYTKSSSYLRTLTVPCAGTIPSPSLPPTGDQPPLESSSSIPAMSKDVVLNSSHGTSIRLFIPVSSLSDDDSKLPVIIYFHAGGFILLSPAISPIHNFTARLAADLPALVLSVDHRLAPEHRLPAAYDDAVDALLWVRDQATQSLSVEPDPWLKNHADFSRCFLMGSSSGGNIAYHLALRAPSLDIEPVKIAGLIMDQPFFGGEERTESETRMADDRFVPLTVTDLMWELSLPVGANRDHEYSKPRKLKGIMKGKELPRCLVRGYVGDPLIDRMRAVAAMLEEEGAKVVALLNEEGYHGEELQNPGKAQEMVNDLRMFLYEGYSLV